MKETVETEPVSEGRFLSRIRAKTARALADLVKVWALDIFSGTARRLDDGSLVVDGRLSKTEIELLHVHGYVVDVLADADEIASKRQKELQGQAGDGCDSGK